MIGNLIGVLTASPTGLLSIISIGLSVTMGDKFRQPCARRLATFRGYVLSCR
jgi:hypothetical protein